VLAVRLRTSHRHSGVDRARLSAAACAIIALLALVAGAQAQSYCCVCVTGAGCTSATCESVCQVVADSAAC